MIDRMHSLPVTRQCQLLGLNRSTVYYQPQGISEEDLRLMMRSISNARSMAVAGCGIICRIWGIR